MLDKEIKALEHELKKVFKEAQTESDIVTGSSPVFPYVKTCFQVTDDDKGIKTKIEQLKHIIKNRRNNLLNKRLEIEQFMDDIKDPEIRLIIHLKYIKGFSWLEVSNHIYDYPSETRAYMRLKRYFN